MDQQKEHTVVEQLREVMPLKAGGKRVLMVLAALPILFWVSNELLRPFVSWGNRQILVAFISCIGTILWTHFLLTEKGYHQIRHPFDWFKIYLKRNVIGYRARFYLHQDGSFDVVTALRTEPAEGSDRLRPFRLTLSLGGWRQRWCPAFVEPAGWQSSFRFISDRFENIFINLKDFHGQTLTISLDTVFALFLPLHYQLGVIMDWSALLKGATLQHELSIDSLREKLNWRNDDEIANLKFLIDRMEDTRRFIKSKEAGRIREHMVERLLTILPEDDPQRSRYEKSETEAA